MKKFRFFQNKKMYTKLAILGLIPILALGTLISVLRVHEASATINGTNELVSYDSTNTSPVGASTAAPSDDGKFVVFVSNYSNIVAGDTNGKDDVFIRNLQTGVTTLVDQSTSGVWAQLGVNHDASPYFNVSKTGRYVLFASYDKYLIDGQTQNGKLHIYLRDTVANTTSLVDQTTSGIVGDDDARVGDISDDGRFAFFSSKAKNLGGATDGLLRVYRKDLSDGSLLVVSRSESGVNANNPASNVRASCDGSIAVFASSATNLTPSNNGYVSAYLVDLRSGFKITNLTLFANNNINDTSSISCDGRYILLLSQATNITSDTVDGTVQHLFRYDRIEGTYELVDKSESGTVSSTFSSAIPLGPGRKVSDNGAVVFKSGDKNIVTPSVASTTDIYLRTPEDNTTELININSSGQESMPVTSAQPNALAITSNGKGIIYTSSATNLIPGVTGSGYVVLSRVQ